MGFLIDTCIWIDLEQGRCQPEQIAAITGENPLYASPISIAELKLGVDLASDPAERNLRQAALLRLQNRPSLAIDNDTAVIFGSLAASLAQTKKSHRRHSNNLWLAAQAIQHHLHLLTRNSKDFAGLPGLSVAAIED